MTTRTSCRTQRDWVSFGTLERRGKVALSSPSFQLFKPINSRKLSLMKSLFSMSTDPSPSFFLLKSFHQKCARAIEFGNVVDALVDSTGKTSVNVVRSERFASHKPQTVGFAFEDRHEVETDFPDLKSTFDRLKGLAFHF